MTKDWYLKSQRVVLLQEELLQCSTASSTRIAEWCCY